MCRIVVAVLELELFSFLELYSITLIVIARCVWLKKARGPVILIIEARDQGGVMLIETRMKTYIGLL